MGRARPLLRGLVALEYALRYPDRLSHLLLLDSFGFTHLYSGWSVMDRLREIETPTLVLSGREDFLSPSEHVAILADRLPDARLEIVERAGHNAHVERTTEVIGIIERFLAMAAEEGATRTAELSRERTGAVGVSPMAAWRPFTHPADVPRPELSR